MWRLIALRWLRWDTVLRVLLFVGAALAAFAIDEHSSGRNILFMLVPSGYQGGEWARSIFRNGVIRVEGSFGEPISFRMFLAVCSIAAVTIAISAKSLALRCFAIAATAAMTLAIIDSAEPARPRGCSRRL